MDGESRFGRASRARAGGGGDEAVGAWGGEELDRARHIGERPGKWVREVVGTSEEVEAREALWRMSERGEKPRSHCIDV